MAEHTVNLSDGVTASEVFVKFTARARVLTGDGTTARGGSSVQGLWVSKPGTNVIDCADGDLLFDSTAPSFGQILLFQTIGYSAGGTAGTPVTTTQTYLNHGGVKTYFFWWMEEGDIYDGGEHDGYRLDRGYFYSGAPITSTILEVSNTYTNSTTNTITITSYSSSSGKVIVMVLKEAAA